MKKLLCVGDLHFREKLGYSEYFEDGRKQEKEDILNTILASSADCDGVVLLGDNFHYKNNSSEVIREFVEFVEKLGGKKVFILAGNHEKFGDGKSAVDFMGEIKKPNWNIITNKIEVIDDLVFCPYFFRNELKASNSKMATKKLLEMLPKGSALFLHHSISKTPLPGGVTTDILDEVVLPVEKLSTMYKIVFAGHIHKNYRIDNVYIAGSVFANEIGDGKKGIYTIDLENEKVTSIPLPGRVFMALENPTKPTLEKLQKGTFVKVIITEEMSKEWLKAAKKILDEKVDAYIITERIANSKRETAKIDDILNFSTEDLLKLFAKERGVDANKLLTGFNLIK